MKLRRLAALTGALALLGFSGCIPDFMMPKGEKPVLYLYPPEETTVTVSLSLDGELTCAYPAMEEGGWTVTARPDGALVDEAGREYPYLFWEGTLAAEWDFSSGFVVEGSRTADFLEEKLEPQGVAVIIEAEHLCMTMRGVRAAGAKTQTSALRGRMKADPRARAEVLDLLIRGR